MAILSFNKLCEKAGLTCDVIASTTGASLQTIKGWRSGEAIPLEIAKKIRDLCKPEYHFGLIYWVNEPQDCLFLDDNRD